MPEADADAIVIGSGFGGSVSACRLAQSGADVLVLERGRAWPPGSFPRTPFDLKDRGFWEPEDGAKGLFDLQTFDHFAAITSSGLGGGSLIYANVLLRKDAQTFEGWPVTREDLEPGYDAAEAMLGATRYPYADTTPKAREFAAAARRFGAGTVEHPPLAIAFGDAPRQPVVGAAPSLYPGAHRVSCTLCGECDTGCNTGAKQTLDHTYLAAAVAAGARIRCGAEVVRLQREDGLWAVTYALHRDLCDPALPDLHFDDGRDRVTVRAPVVVLSAGVFGTARLLLGARGALPGLSPRLGEAVSVNGDVLSFAFDTDAALQPSVGPVITTSLRLRDDESESGRELLLQDAGSPAWAEWLWHLREVPGDVLRALAGPGAVRLRQRLRGDVDTRLGADATAMLGSGRAGAHMLPLLAMGRDVPDGRLHLKDGELRCTWSLEPSKAHYDEVDRVAGAVTRELGGTFMDGRGLRKMRTMTVHPLGGAAMGATWKDGVVDSHGEVFGQPGLFVADGSVMPGPVGPNPSLTIAALAERFSTRMRERLA